MTNTATGARFEATTDSLGLFQISERLPESKYRVTATAPGFQSFSRDLDLEKVDIVEFFCSEPVILPIRLQPLSPELTPLQSRIAEKRIATQTLAVQATISEKGRHTDFSNSRKWSMEAFDPGSLLLPPVVRVVGKGIGSGFLTQNCMVLSNLHVVAKNLTDDVVGQEFRFYPFRSSPEGKVESHSAHVVAQGRPTPGFANLVDGDWVLGKDDACLSRQGLGYMTLARDDRGWGTNQIAGFAGKYGFDGLWPIHFKECRYVPLAPDAGFQVDCPGAPGVSGGPAYHLPEEWPQQFLATGMHTIGGGGLIPNSYFLHHIAPLLELSDDVKHLTRITPIINSLSDQVDLLSGRNISKQAEPAAVEVYTQYHKFRVLTDDEEPYHQCAVYAKQGSGEIALGKALFDTDFRVSGTSVNLPNGERDGAYLYRFVCTNRPTVGELAETAEVITKIPVVVDHTPPQVTIERGPTALTIHVTDNLSGISQVQYWVTEKGESSPNKIKIAIEIGSRNLTSVIPVPLDRAMHVQVKDRSGNDCEIAIDASKDTFEKK